MFVATGLGLLVKGPVMLAWIVGGSLGAALFERSRRPLRWLGWWPGWTLALGMAGAWFALASRRFPEYAHYAFLEETLERVGSGAFHRQQPLWFAPAVVIGGALPWSLTTVWMRRLTSQSVESNHCGIETRQERTRTDEDAGVESNHCGIET